MYLVRLSKQIIGGASLSGCRVGLDEFEQANGVYFFDGRFTATYQRVKLAELGG
jgi:hypothetical protein